MYDFLWRSCAFFEIDSGFGDDLKFFLRALMLLAFGSVDILDFKFFNGLIRIFPGRFDKGGFTLMQFFGL